MSLAPGSPIGRYVVRHKLAEGGMAEIYLCSVRGPEGFEKEVVIKRIRAFLASDQNFIDMFIAEARVASRLNHANLVQIFDFDKHEDSYYLAMEYVRGHSLFEVRRRATEQRAPMAPLLAAHIGAQVARGLHYAHRVTENGQRLGLVHRDVTPHNVLVSFEGAVKLTDFGIAKAGGKLTSPGMLKGKFAYMSPEQARGEPVDARTDVFALGVVLWEMLTGGRLFEGDSDVAVLRAVQHSVIAPPARLNNQVSAALDAMVMKALARDPALRYQTAQELERDLASHVLATSTSVDDTDVSAYVRMLFPGESSLVVSNPQLLKGEGDASLERPGTRTEPEPTALLPPSRPSAEPQASTFRSLALPPVQAPSPPPLPGAQVAHAPLDSKTAPTLPRPTVGMRRGLRVGLGLLSGIAVAAVIISYRARHPGPAATVAVNPHVSLAASGGRDEPEEQDKPDGGLEPETASSDEILTASTFEGDAGLEFEGSLSLRATPWAKVKVDGVLLRRELSPRRQLLRLPAGHHTVQFLHPSRPTAEPEGVEILPGTETSLEFRAR